MMTSYETDETIKAIEKAQSRPMSALDKEIIQRICTLEARAYQRGLWDGATGLRPENAPPPQPQDATGIDEYFARFDDENHMENLLALLPDLGDCRPADRIYYLCRAAFVKGATRLMQELEEKLDEYYKEDNVNEAAN